MSDRRPPSDPIQTLRRLDPGLAVAPPAAVDVRRRGDRLRRRRRASVAVAVVASVTALAAPLVLDGGAGGSPPVAGGPSPTPPSRPAGRLIVPDGFAGLRLGMTVAEVRATGDATLEPATGGRCRTFTLTGDLPAAASGSETDGFLSRTYGLAAVFARPGVTTDVGVGTGSTLAEVRAAYPDGVSSPGWFRVPLGKGREYEFGIDGGVVETLSVRLVEQDCFG